MQRRRTPGRHRREEDEFRRRYRILVDDLELADQLRDPALHAALVSGRVPPWTVVGDELYTVVATRRPLSPAMVEANTAALLRLVDLLDLRQ